MSANPQLVEMAAAPEQLLQEVLETSRRMQELAGAGAWQELSGLEQERRSMIHSCFAPTVLFPDPQQAAAVIEQIMMIDEGIVALAAKARDEMAETLVKVRQGRSATRAYHACEQQR